MIICYLKYKIDPYQLEAFRVYARKWLELVPRFGGQHLGYFLPYEGRNDEALALFGFPSLSAYENYREKSQSDPDCQAAYDFAAEHKCILHYERSFLKALAPELYKT